MAWQFIKAAMGNQGRLRFLRSHNFPNTMRKKLSLKIQAILSSVSKGKSCPRRQGTEPRSTRQRQTPTRMLPPKENILLICSRQKGSESPSAFCTSPSFRTRRYMEQHLLQKRRMARSATPPKLSKGEFSETVPLRLTEFRGQQIITTHRVGFHVR